MDIFAEAEIREICWEVSSDSFSEYNWSQFPLSSRCVGGPNEIQLLLVPDWCPD